MIALILLYSAYVSYPVLEEEKKQSQLTLAGHQVDGKGYALQ